MMVFWVIAIVLFLAVVLVCAANLYVLFPKQVKPRPRQQPSCSEGQSVQKGPTAPERIDSPTELSWTLNAQTFRTHRRIYVPDFPELRILVDKVAGAVTFENCFIPGPVTANKPEATHTCDLTDISGVYMSRSFDVAAVLPGRTGSQTSRATTIVTRRGRAVIPDCSGFDCEPDAVAIRDYLAEISESTPTPSLARLPSFHSLILIAILGLGIVTAAIILWVAT
jgi:hypothetical protein